MPKDILQVGPLQRGRISHPAAIRDSETSIALIMPDADMNLAAFQHGGLFATKGLIQLHVHIGKEFG